MIVEFWRESLQNFKVLSLQVSLSGRSQGSTFIRPNEKRRKRGKENCVEKKREFLGISMEFLEKQRAMCVT